MVRNDKHFEEASSRSIEYNGLNWGNVASSKFPTRNVSRMSQEIDGTLFPPPSKERRQSGKIK